MKKKPGNQKQRKEKSLPKPLLSRQWQSESTLSQRASHPAAPADGSPSATGAPPTDPCKDAGKAPASVVFNEIPTDVKYEHPEGDNVGATWWSESPSFGTGIFCDGVTKTWVCRVTSASGRQTQKVGIPNVPLDAATIAAAPDCRTLDEMWQQVFANIRSLTVSGYCPKDGFVQAHEDVHRSHGTASVLNHFAVLVSEIGALSLSCEDYSSSEAEAVMQPGITNALNRFFDHFLLDELNDQDHRPPDDFIAAQDAAGNPWLDAIVAEMVTRGCRTQ